MSIMRWNRNPGTLAVGIAACLTLSVVAVETGRMASALVPSDVLVRSDIARANMQRVYAAMMMYANDNRGRFPLKLSALYPRYINDPAAFWHPGDSDPMPTTINNDLPNQPNSTRISFEYTTSATNNLCETQPVIWDNTAANNAGWFVNKYTGNGIVTDPPWITPTPTRRDVGRNNLRLIGLNLLFYAYDNGGELPTDPAQLANGYICSPSLFWHPGDSDPEPTQITNSVPNAVNSARISFDFPGAGRDLMTMEPWEIIVQDNSPANNEGAGIHVVYADGHLAFLARILSDIDQDGDVDGADYGLFASCFNGTGMPVPASCLAADFNNDQSVDGIDYGLFAACFNGTGNPPACQ